MRIIQLTQLDNYSFKLTWSDGLEQVFNLSDLQKQCPCASCDAGMSPPVDQKVKCIEIKSVGRYGLRIQYTSGCMSGIYSFDYLRSLSSEVFA